VTEVLVDETSLPGTPRDLNSPRKMTNFETFLTEGTVSSVQIFNRQKLRNVTGTGSAKQKF
jgi:hypothetical protein